MTTIPNRTALIVGAGIPDRKGTAPGSPQFP